MSDLQTRFDRLRARIAAAAAQHHATNPVRLLAVSKAQPPTAIAALADLGQRAFGENYVQEALAKIAALTGRDLEWHCIGHLQSNKAHAAANAFAWVQSVDRERLISALNAHRDPALPPLNVLIQVNIDAEPGKSGCAPEQVDTLAEAIIRAPRLRLRGLMAIPKPDPSPQRRTASFARMAALYRRLRDRFPTIDTLSMGMSDDFELAIAQQANLVRIGTALFGARSQRPSSDGHAARKT